MPNGRDWTSASASESVSWWSTLCWWQTISALWKNHSYSLTKMKSKIIIKIIVCTGWWTWRQRCSMQTSSSGNTSPFYLSSSWVISFFNPFFSTVILQLLKILSLSLKMVVIAVDDDCHNFLQVAWERCGWAQAWESNRVEVSRSSLSLLLLLSLERATGLGTTWKIWFDHAPAWDLGLVWSSHWRFSWLEEMFN